LDQVTKSSQFPIVVALLAFAGFGVLLFLPLPRYFATPLGQSFLNATHLPVFAVFAWAGAVLWRRFAPWKSLSAGSANWISAGIITLAALAVEVIQPVFGRSASVEDAAIGILGIGLFLVGTRCFGGGRPRWKIAVWGICALACVLIVTQPILREITAMGYRSSQFPVLGDFERDQELSYWIPAGYLEPRPKLVSRSTENVSSGSASLRIDASVGKWPGVFLNTGSQDWSNHEALTLDFHNPGTPFQVGIRLDDDHADSEVWGYRYDGLFTLSNGWNHISIPTIDIARGGWRRGMNITDIRRMIIFIDAETKPRVFHLDNVRLR
jgi:hypothetical protein